MGGLRGRAAWEGDVARVLIPINVTKSHRQTRLQKTGDWSCKKSLSPTAKAIQARFSQQQWSMPMKNAGAHCHVPCLSIPPPSASMQMPMKMQLPTFDTAPFQLTRQARWGLASQNSRGARFLATPRKTFNLATAPCTTRSCSTTPKRACYTCPFDTTPTRPGHRSMPMRKTCFLP